MYTILKAYTLSECMERTAEYLQAYERQGDKNLVFCEDRLTLIAERAIAAKLGGTFFTGVTTFARFIDSSERTITKQGSVMAVGNVMTKLQREGALQCFQSASGVGKNARSIYETLAQFAASEITPQVLKDSAALLPEDTLKKKICDLALIYEGYDAFLRENGYLDESRYLSLLPQRLRENEALKDTNVFFLCFGSFTAQAMRVVETALSCAKNVVGVFCAGEEEFYCNAAAQSFARLCRENGKTRVVEAGTPLEGEAEALRKGLFDPEHKERFRVATDKVRLFEADDKTAEVTYVAVQIRKALAENDGLRYRDFALLVPDVASYSLPIKRALAEYGVPYFIDEKRSLKRHPLSRFLLDCFRVVKENYSPAAVQSLAQNPFFGESDEYRNYLLKFANYRGGAKKEIKGGEAVETLFSMPALYSGRERLLKATKNIKPTGHGRDYCAAVGKILLDFEAEKRLSDLESDVEDVSQKSYLSQIYGALEHVLGEAALLTDGREMTAAEFAAVLEDGLDATEISLIPLKADAVFVGDVTDSRIEKVHTLFALGMTDAVPRMASDAAIVSDKDIARLAEVKTLLEPTVAEVNLRARENTALNLCTFTDRLYLSYPLSLDGSEPTVSEVFRYIDAIFCDADGRDLPREKKIADLDFRYLCGAPAPALRQLLLEKTEFESTAGEISAKLKARKNYSTLYTALDKLSVTEKDDYLQEGRGQVCVERGEELFFKDGKISPTALEEYFDCPFKNFIQRGLKLKDREETAVLAMDTGNFIHELLERTAGKMSETESEEEMASLARKIGAELLKRPVYAAQADTASGAFFADKLLEEGANVVVAAYRQVKNSSFQVEETEKSVETGAFRGKIDRVDGTDKYVRVVDYKTGAIDDSSVSYYTGRKLQMQLYMSAIKGERIPAGVFYFPASVDYADSAEGRFRMKGFLNGDEAALRAGDSAISENQQSEYFPAALKNTRSRRVMDEATFCDFLDYADLVAKQGCKELKEGFIAPSPYDGGCEYCKYGGACGYNREKYAARKESSIDPSEIAKIVREVRAEKESEESDSGEE